MKNNIITPLFFRRLLVYVLGNFVLAAGVVLTVKSDLGISPINSPSLVLSNIFTIDLGLMTAIIYASFVLLQFAILGKNFKIYSFLQIAMNLIFSFFVSLCTRLLSFSVPELYALRISFHLLGIAFIGLGISIYLRTKMLPLPPEGLVLAISQRFGWKPHNVKVCVDCSAIVVAVIISLAATGSIFGVREGTLIAMIGIGKSMGFFTKHLGQKIDTMFRL